MFFGPSAGRLWSKINKKTSPGRSKIKQKIRQHLDPIFDGSWNQLGWILGGFWRPSWSQVGTKCHQNLTPKPIKKIITFLEPSGAIFGVSWLPRAVSHFCRSPFFLALGAILAPRRPQDAPRRPKTPQDAPKKPYRRSITSQDENKTAQGRLRSP